MIGTFSVDDWLLFRDSSVCPVGTLVYCASVVLFSDSMVSVFKLVQKPSLD